ncbi:phosphatase PAP2 family protein [Streptomyces massasporeus]
MSVLAAISKADRQLTKRLAASTPPALHRTLSAVEEVAERTKLWCGAAVVMAAVGEWRGRTAAAAGGAAMVLAQLVSNGLCKQLADRERPPEQWFAHDEAKDRPESSSFPSGHTTAVAFTAATASAWPTARAVCAVPAAMVAVDQVQSGAHYPSDVAAGAGIGLAAATLVRRAPRLVPRWQSFG